MATPKRAPAVGPTSATTAQNIAAARRALGLTAQQVSDATAEIGWPLGRAAISEIERGARRIDVDDLVALAIVLKVNPNSLLMPDYFGDEDVSDDVTGVAGATGRQVWEWADGWHALPMQTEQIEVADDATGVERGRQMWAQRNAAKGFGFDDRVVPKGEITDRRSFLRQVYDAVHADLPRRLSLWSSDGDLVAQNPVRTIRSSVPRSSQIEDLRREALNIISSSYFAEVAQAVARAHLEQNPDGDG